MKDPSTDSSAWWSVLPCSRASTSSRIPTGSSSVSFRSWQDLSDSVQHTCSADVRPAQWRNRFSRKKSFLDSLAFSINLRRFLRSVRPPLLFSAYESHALIDNRRSNPREWSEIWARELHWDSYKLRIQDIRSWRPYRPLDQCPWAASSICNREEEKGIV